MPRLGLHVFAPAFCAEAFPIKASDDPFKDAGKTVNKALAGLGTKATW